MIDVAVGDSQGQMTEHPTIQSDSDYIEFINSGNLEVWQNSGIDLT